MVLFNNQAASVKHRFTMSIIAGVISAVLLGVVSGYFRQYVFNHAIVLTGVGLLIAMLINRVGRGIQLKFAIVAVLSTLLAIILSDIISEFGILGLINMESIRLTFSSMLKESISSVLWFLYRALALYVAYIYSRVV
ncbi:hypothetical protein [Erysipelothrix aquatica]|uniref:hypothetical protein n=1 Tax=Erysipelothrix aquatica TaxID=2683714 RepID=UPI00135B8309|nr:hypothetical protein [Erysipelothrix aquatica]